MRFHRRTTGHQGVGRVVAVVGLALAIGASSAAGALGAVGTAGGARVQAPDLILDNGRFITMDDRRPTAQAIAITDDRITAVGSSREIARLATRATRRIHLRRRTVVPGLIDGHTHAIRGGQTFGRETYWLGVDSLATGLSMLSDAARGRRPDEWVGRRGVLAPEPVP
jgi:predicted amidohydrolase YtcJ